MPSDKRQVAEKPVTEVADSDKGKLKIDIINDMLAQISGNSGSNNSNDTSSSKREVPKDPATGKYIAAGVYRTEFNKLHE